MARFRVDRYSIINAVLLLFAALGGAVMVISLIIAGLNYSQHRNLMLNQPTPSPTSTTDSGIPPYVLKPVKYDFSSAKQLKAFKEGGYGRVYLSKGRLALQTYTGSYVNVKITVSFAKDTTMSFTDKISSEPNYDFGYFYIDGQERGYASGTEGKAKNVYQITAGKHTFEWRYQKDLGTSIGDDRYYIDNIVFNDVTPQGW